MLKKFERLLEELNILVDVGNPDDVTSEIAEHIESLAWRKIYFHVASLPTKPTRHEKQQAVLNALLYYMPGSHVAKLTIIISEDHPGLMGPEHLYEDIVKEVFFADSVLQAVFKAQDFAYAALRRYVAYKRVDLPGLTEQQVFKVMQGREHTYVERDAVPMEEQ